MYFIVGLDGNFVSQSTFPVACGFGTWMLTLGFTLAYGAMFSKIWRVRRLSTKNKSDIKKVSKVNTFFSFYYIQYNFQKYEQFNCPKFLLP